MKGWETSVIVYILPGLFRGTASSSMVAWYSTRLYGYFFTLDSVLWPVRCIVQSNRCVSTCYRQIEKNSADRRHNVVANSSNCIYRIKTFWFPTWICFYGTYCGRNMYPICPFAYCITYDSHEATSLCKRCIIPYSKGIVISTYYPNYSLSVYRT